MTVVVDTLSFDFPSAWQAAKYDGWESCKKFQSLASGTKAVDMVAVSPSGKSYLIEAKDFRVHPRSNPASLSDEVVHKCRDTLGGVLATALQANSGGEQNLARAFTAGSGLTVVFHCAVSPTSGNKLFPANIDLAGIQQKLRIAFSRIGVDAYVESAAGRSAHGWSVQ